MSKLATKVSELPALLGGLPVGSRIRIKGYVDSSNVVKDLELETLPKDAYAKMRQESLKILEKETAPDVPGFHPSLVAQARDALMESLRDDVERPKKAFTDPYVEAEEGGYSRKPGEDAIYLLRTKDVSSKKREITDPRRDLVRAKAALSVTLDLPSSRYLHTVKLIDSKFVSVEVLD